MSSYRHTQTGRWHHLVVLTGIVMIVAAWPLQHAPLAAAALAIGGAVCATSGYCFGRLTIADEGDRLGVRFGPIPLFGTSIAYADITAVETGSTTLLDGWGIHYVPGRGWTYNLWGYGCVLVRVGGKAIHLGTDDPEGLAGFLRERTGG